MTKPVIEASNLSKVYRTDGLTVTALSDVSFTVNQGEFVSIMGPSGSGKSTLMHILGTLDLPTSGVYRLDKEDITKLSDDELAEVRNRKIGFVFQFYNLLPRTSALENVMLPMDYAGIPDQEQEKKAKELLGMVGLSERLNHAPNQLSGGEQQRIAIARALAMDPAIILADEPTGNVATDQSIEIMEIFDRLNKKGHTVVVITHENEVAECTKRIIYLRDGEVEKDVINKHRRKLATIVK
ncbi:MAG: ABC transporter ATP-binding protein [Candidatus Shapirobacteria bacterium]|nr:ABC transporter ATP-binding protein [Candidatus Shapirobacteria bacterium]MDD5481886.1 ABC transporter ATP-binding protein [Candidatus Shapirobacteria bacterium]